VFALFVGLSLAAREAHAQPAEPLELDWPSHEGCPRREEVLAEAYRLLGGRPEASARRVRAAATVTPNAGKWRLEMQTESDGARGKRSLSAETCRALGEAAALILALAYDPEAVARHDSRVDPAPPPKEPPAPRAEPLPSPPPPAPPPALRASPPPSPAWPPRPRPKERAGTGRSWNLAVGGHIASDLGSMPAAAFGLGGALALVTRRLRIGLEATYWLDQRALAKKKAGAGGDFSFVSGAASGCPLLLERPVMLGLCAGVELGRMHAAGFGVDHPSEFTSFWSALRFDALATLRVDRALALRAELGAAVPVSRPSWLLDRVGEVHRAEPVAGRGLLAVEAYF
jgi:hypothetical protein